MGVIDYLIAEIVLIVGLFDLVPVGWGVGS